MEHNAFKFTIKFLAPNATKGALKYYIQTCCDEMEHDSVEFKKYLAINSSQDIFIVYVTLITKDYGVPDVGVDLVASWVGQLYQNIDGFLIDTIIIHPKSDPPAKGAIIKWDYANNSPIVSIIPTFPDSKDYLP